MDSSLVLINASVTDRDGHFVGGLDRSSFRLYDGGKEQKILSFSQEDAPISVGIVFDVSGSMKDALTAARQALHGFLAGSNPRDEFAAVVVRDHPDLALRFTRDPDEIGRELDTLQAGGSTALRDSIYLAAQKMKAARNARKALLIISDGMDNHSRYRAADLKRFFQEADVIVYSIRVFRAFPEDEAEEGRELLESIAKDTGGRYVQANRPKDVAQAMEKLDIRNEYMLGFAPQGVAADGQYHRVGLKLIAPARASRLEASWRRGYYALDNSSAPLPPSRRTSLSPPVRLH